jgi:hypothetical protein
MICAMEKHAEPRVVRVDDFVAESLEEEANRMPPSYKAQADLLRQQAKNFRESGRTNMVRIWEETS